MHKLTKRFIVWAIICAPLVWIGQIPKALISPKGEEGEKYNRYLQKLGNRLAENPHLEGVTMEPVQGTLNVERIYLIKLAGKPGNQSS